MLSFPVGPIFFGFGHESIENFVLPLFFPGHEKSVVSGWSMVDNTQGMAATMLENDGGGRRGSGAGGSGVMAAMTVAVVAAAVVVVIGVDDGV